MIKAFLRNIKNINNKKKLIKSQLIFNNTPYNISIEQNEFIKYYITNKLITNKIIIGKNLINTTTTNITLHPINYYINTIILSNIKTNKKLTIKIIYINYKKSPYYNKNTKLKIYINTITLSYTNNTPKILIINLKTILKKYTTLQYLIKSYNIKLHNPHQPTNQKLYQII